MHSFLDVREARSVTSIASDANQMTGMYMAKPNGQSGQSLYYLRNIEQETSQPQDLSVTLPLTTSNPALGQTNDGGILLADQNAVYLYNPRNKKPDFKKQEHNCNHKFSGDLVGHPTAIHSNFTVREQHVYILSGGQLVQASACKSYPNLRQLTALSFTCNGELYAGTDTAILKGHTIQDFASQPGCKLYNAKQRRR
jgi:hypothetical protein